MNALLTGLQRIGLVMLVLMALVLFLLWGAMTMLRELLSNDAHGAPSCPPDDGTGASFGRESVGEIEFVSTRDETQNKGMRVG
jgi:hypothetical protein